MDLRNVISQFTTKEQKKLAVAQNAGELSKIAEAMGHGVSRDEAEAIFAMFYPVRGRERLGQEELEKVLGGYEPKSTGSLRGKNNPGYLNKLRF